MDKLIGIDLGTTISDRAAFIGCRPTIIPALDVDSSANSYDLFLIFKTRFLREKDLCKLSTIIFYVK